MLATANMLAKVLAKMLAMENMLAMGNMLATLKTLGCGLQRIGYWLQKLSLICMERQKFITELTPILQNIQLRPPSPPSPITES